MSFRSISFPHYRLLQPLHCHCDGFIASPECLNALPLDPDSAIFSLLLPHCQLNWFPFRGLLKTHSLVRLILAQLTRNSSDTRLVQIMCLDSFTEAEDGFGHVAVFGFASKISTSHLWPKQLLGGMRNSIKWLIWGARNRHSSAESPGSRQHVTVWLLVSSQSRALLIDFQCLELSSPTSASF